MRAVLDSNILIDYLNGRKEAREEIGRYHPPAISVITWMEVLVGARNDAEADTIRSFLERFEVIEISRDVAEHAVELRRERRMLLPDAIVWATARALGCILVSRNCEDFPPDEPDVRVPYEIA